MVRELRKHGKQMGTENMGNKWEHMGTQWETREKDMGTRWEIAKDAGGFFVFINMSLTDLW